MCTEVDEAFWGDRYSCTTSQKNSVIQEPLDLRKRLDSKEKGHGINHREIAYSADRNIYNIRFSVKNWNKIDTPPDSRVPCSSAIPLLREAAQDKDTSPSSIHQSGMNGSVSVIDSTPGIMEARCGSTNLLSAAEAIDAASAAISPSQRSSNSVGFYCRDIHSPLSANSSASSERSNSHWDSNRNNSDLSDGEEYPKAARLDDKHAHSPAREDLAVEKVQLGGSNEFRRAYSQNDEANDKRSKRDRVEEIVTGFGQVPTHSAPSSPIHLTSEDDDEKYSKPVEHVDENQHEDEYRDDDFSKYSRKRKMQDLKQKIKILHSEYQNLQDHDMPQVEENEKNEDVDNSMPYQENDEAKHLVDIVEDASSPGQFFDHALDYIKGGKESNRKGWAEKDMETQTAYIRQESYERTPKRVKTDEDTHSTNHSSEQRRSAKPTRYRVSSRQGSERRPFIDTDMRPPLPYPLLSSTLSPEEILFVEAFKREVANAVESAAETSALRVLNALGANGIFLGRDSSSRSHLPRTSDKYNQMFCTEEKARSNRQNEQRRHALDDRKSSFDKPSENRDELTINYEGKPQRHRTTSRSQMCVGSLEIHPTTESKSMQPMGKISSESRHRDERSLPYDSSSKDAETISELVDSRYTEEQTQALSLVTNKKGEKPNQSPKQERNYKSPRILLQSTNPPKSFPPPNPFMQYPFPNTKGRFTSVPPINPFMLPTQSYPGGSISSGATHPLAGFLPGLQVNPFALPGMQDRHPKGENPFHNLVPDFSAYSSTASDLAQKWRANLDASGRKAKLKDEMKGSQTTDASNASLYASIAANLSRKTSPLLRRAPSYSPVLSSSPTAGTIVSDPGFLPGGSGSAFRRHGIPPSPTFSLQTPKSYPKRESYDKMRRGRLSQKSGTPERSLKPMHTIPNPMYPFPPFPFIPGLPQSSQFATALASMDYQNRIKEGLNDYCDSSAALKLTSCRMPVHQSIRSHIRESGKFAGSLSGSLSMGDSCDYGEGEQSHYAFPNNIQEGLTPQHLKKAKLIFFYTRYPNANTLKTYFPDVKFTRAITSQLIKWFSNFREFFYIQMEKFARQAVTEEIMDVSVIRITRDSELFRVLNLHYNKCNEFRVPDRFLRATEASLREFFMAVKDGKDCDPAWKKVIYKVICKLDSDIPEVFKSPNVLDRIHEIVD